MKYLSVVLLSLLFCTFVVGCFCFNNTQTSTSINDADYLRLHIRANSNSSEDQNVKYLVKSEVLNFINADCEKFTSKQNIENYFAQNKNKIESYVNLVLKQNNFNYTSNIKLNNEYFPTRTYNNVTLEGGFYDAIIIELGSAEGNNWWCVAYPPLCFMYESSNFGNITYKSKLYEIISKFFKE